jgi:large subunit ribosomal protein L23
MSIIIKPMVTEKMSQIEEKVSQAIAREKNPTTQTKHHRGTRGKYAFKVAVNANKIEIKRAIQDLYNVTVEDVNTTNYAGKKKSRFTKAGVIEGRTGAYKKAVVTVKQGESIDFYSNI